MLRSKGVKEVPVKAESSGYLAAVDTFAVGRAICDIGGGRVFAEDKIDHAVGFATLKKIGDRVTRGEAFGVVHCRRQAQADAISEKLTAAYKIAKEKPRITKLIKATV
jgi:thymidine phosphorylase